MDLGKLTEIFSTLPEGYLPKWLLFTSALGIFNSVQNFCTDSLTKRVYANKPHEGKLYKKKRMTFFNFVL